MQVRCPFCKTPIELSGDSQLSDIVCPSCDSSFNLLGNEETASYEPGTKTIGHFKLLDRIGFGTFGVVWRARDIELERTVAVKMPRKGQLNVEETEQFLREAKAAAQLLHPNIVSVHEVGREDDSAYIVSDFVEGITLADRLTAQQFSARESAELCIKIADALHHAHQARVVHRDLKPSNIMLDTAGEPHIMDFGLARREIGDVTMTVDGRVLGTPAYMSPEQAQGESHLADRRSDVYSLGVILFQLLTGELPFRGNARMLLYQVINDEPPSPRKLDVSVPRDLETICLQCLEKNPERRYQTSAELSDDLKSWLTGNPVRARPIGRIQRTWRWATRNPGLASLGTAILLLLLTVAIGSSLFAVRERKLRQNIELMELYARQIAYSYDMKWAQQLIEKYQFGRAWELLDRNRPQASQKDLRGWEWRYLWRLCKSDAHFDFCVTDYSVFSLSASQDGRWLAIGNWEGGGVTLWDVSAKKELHKPPSAGSRSLVAFSPKEPILAYSTDEESSTDKRYHAVLWNYKIKEIVAKLQLDRRCVGLLFNAAGDKLVTATKGSDGQITVWQAPSWEKLVSYLAPQYSADEAIPFAISQDASVAAYGDGPQLHLIDLITGQRKWSIKATDDKSLIALEFSPDGNTLASSAGYGDFSIRLWSSDSGDKLGCLEGHHNWVGDLVFWPDGKTLASASADETIRIWDVTNIKVIPPPQVLAGHRHEVWRLALLPDNKAIVSSSFDGSVKVWDITNADPRSGHTVVPGETVAWAFSPDSRSVLTVDKHGCVARWSGTEFRQKEILIDLSTDISHGLFWFSGNLGQLAVRSSDRSVQIWDIQQLRPINQLNASGNELLSFVDRGERILILNRGLSRIDEWDVSKGMCARDWPVPSGEFALDDWALGIISPNGKQLVSFGQDGKVVVSNRMTGTTTTTDLGFRQVQAASFSPKGVLVAVNGLGFARLLEFPSLREIDTVHIAQVLHQIAFSSDGQRIAFTSGREIRIWATESWQEELVLNWYFFPRCQFSKNGNIIGAGGKDHPLSLWHAPSFKEINAQEARRSNTGP